VDTKINRKVKCLESLIVDMEYRKFPLRQIILFGSFSTNNFHERSDLDLCLIHDDGREPTCTEKVAIESYVDSHVGEEMNVDFLYATPIKLENGRQVFDSIRKEGLILWQHSGI